MPLRKPRASRAAAQAPAPRRRAAGRKAAFTLRLDAERHLRLRLACAVTGRSAQQIVTGALDALLAAIPEIEALAERVPPATAQAELNSGRARDMNRTAFKIAASTVIVAMTMVGVHRAVGRDAPPASRSGAESRTDRQAAQLHDQASRALQQGQLAQAVDADGAGGGR